MKKKLHFTIAIFSAILFVFLALLIQQRYLNLPLPFDTIIQQFIFAHRTPGLNFFFTHYTLIFGNIGAVITALIFFILLIFCKKFIGAFWFAFLVIISTFINSELKTWIGRVRPIGHRLINESGMSFPSGHSVFATILFFSLFLILIQQLHSRFIKFMLFILTFLLTLSVMISRIYVGVHYPSDTIGGFLEGIFLVALTYPIFYYFASKKHKH